MSDETTTVKAWSVSGDDWTESVVDGVRYITMKREKADNLINQLLTTRITAARKQAELLQRITDLEAQLAEARRREELLRAVAGAAHDFIETVAYLDVDPRTARYSEKLQAAIDGGALETLAYREGFEAGKTNGDKPEPYPPYKIGTDLANDWLRGYRSAIDGGALEP